MWPSSIYCTKLAEAGSFLARQKVRTVFCDDALPDGNFQAVVAAANPTPVVALSRYAEWDSYLAALRAGPSITLRACLTSPRRNACLVSYWHSSPNTAASAAPGPSLAGCFRVEQHSVGTKVGRICPDGSMALCGVLRVRFMEFEIVDAARTIADVQGRNMTVNAAPFNHSGFHVIIAGGSSAFHGLSPLQQSRFVSRLRSGASSLNGN